MKDAAIIYVLLFSDVSMPFPILHPFNDAMQFNQVTCNMKASELQMEVDPLGVRHVFYCMTKKDYLERWGAR